MLVDPGSIVTMRSPGKIHHILIQQSGGDVRRQVRLAPYTSFAIGGVADYFLHARSRKQLIGAVRAAAQLDLPVVVMGAGNNILVSDHGYRGLVIRNRQSSRIAMQPGHIVRVGSGIMLERLVQAVRNQALSGLEFATGIPGTVGGAVFMNAGAFGQEIGDCVIEGDILTTDGEVRTVPRKEFDFNYRSSRLKQTGEILLSVTLQLQFGKKRTIDSRMQDIFTLRGQKHPGPDVPCAGSYFKNLPPEKPDDRRTAAGLVLDKAGARGMQVGGAAVWDGHANFVINAGDATAHDVQVLARKMKQLVRRTFDIRLEEEVVYLDAEKGFRRR
jgi:UDP-N-acetylmuramate dehydrogenase